MGALPCSTGVSGSSPTSSTARCPGKATSCPYRATTSRQSTTWAASLPPPRPSTRSMPGACAESCKPCWPPGSRPKAGEVTPGPREAKDAATAAAVGEAARLAVEAQEAEAAGAPALPRASRNAARASAPSRTSPATTTAVPDVASAPPPRSAPAAPLRRAPTARITTGLLGATTALARVAPSAPSPPARADAVTTPVAASARPDASAPCLGSLIATAIAPHATPPARVRTSGPDGASVNGPTRPR